MYSRSSSRSTAFFASGNGGATPLSIECSIASSRAIPCDWLVRHKSEPQNSASCCAVGGGVLLRKADKSMCAEALPTRGPRPTLAQGRT